MRPTSFIFDCYGVIWSEVGTPWLYKHFSPNDAIRVREKYCPPSDRGDMSEADFFSHLGRLTSQEPAAVCREWVDAAKPNKEVVSLIKKLRQRYKIAALSNSQPALFHEVIKKLKLASLFDVIVVSSEVGMIKPEKQIFDFTLARLHTTAPETVFIDDRENNVRAARTFGLRALLFSTYEDLVTDLAQLRITASADR